MHTLDLYYTTGVSGWRITGQRIVRNGVEREVAGVPAMTRQTDVKNVFTCKAAMVLAIEPSRRTCPHCGSEGVVLYEERKRRIQCHSIGRMRAFVEASVGHCHCPHCGRMHYAHLPFLSSPKATMTRALERTVVELRSAMSISDVARLYGLTWESVKNAEKRALEAKYRTVPLKDVTIIGVDELYVFRHERPNRKYVTVVRDLETGAVLNVSRGKGGDALRMFASRVRKQKPRIACVCMDMSNAYESWVRKNLPDAQIVFDHFHLVKAINDRIDKIRRRTMAKLVAEHRATLASEDADERKKRLAGKAVESLRKELKGQRYLPLRNAEDLDDKGRRKLQKILDHHEELSKAYALKEDLRLVYSTAKDAADASLLLAGWIEKARASKVREMVSAADMVEEHLEGILGFWRFRNATNAKAEGFNGKIRWLIRQACGYHDYKYFRLKVFDLPNLKARDSDC
jgi:transposase